MPSCVCRTTAHRDAPSGCAGIDGEVRIAIIGPGGIGSTFAFQPSEAGHEVTVIARGTRLEQLRHTGAIVTTAGERARVDVSGELDTTTHWDLVLVTVLAPQVDVAAGWNRLGAGRARRATARNSDATAGVAMWYSGSSGQASAPRCLPVRCRLEVHRRVWPDSTGRSGWASAGGRGNGAASVRPEAGVWSRNPLMRKAI